MVALGQNITQVADPDAPYKVAGLPNPYLGLRSFTYADRASFAGRDGYIADALKKLADPGAPQPLLFITGASGSGNANPTSALFDGLVQLGLAHGVVVDVNQLATPVAFAQFLKDKTPATQVNLIVIDPFEELFTQAQLAQSNATLLESPPLAIDEEAYLRYWQLIAQKSAQKFRLWDSKFGR